MTQNKPFSPMNLNEFEKSKMWKIQFSKFVAIRFDKKIDCLEYEKTF